MSRSQECGAKARFWELVQTCLRRPPRATKGARPTLKELLLADAFRVNLPLPPRGRKRRAPESR